MKSPSRSWRLLLTGLLLAFSCLAHGAGPGLRAYKQPEHLHLYLSSEERAWLQQKGTLLVGVSEVNAAPYHLINERNELEGIGADYLGSLLHELAVPLQIRTYPTPAAAFAALKAGEIDLVDSTTQVEAEDYQVWLSPPYAYSKLALFAEDGDLEDYSTHSGLRIATGPGISQELYQQAGGKGQIQRYSTSLMAMASVLDGESDIYLGDTLATDYLSSQLFSNQLVINYNTQAPQIRVGFATASGDSPLSHILERALNSLDRCQITRNLTIWARVESCEPDPFLNHLAPSERAWLENARPLRLVISEDLAPYAFFNSRERFNGIAEDLLDIVRAKTGLHLEVTRVISQNIAAEQLRAGKADLSVLISSSPEHHDYLFSRPFITAPYVMVSTKNAPAMTLSSQPASGTVAIAGGDLLSAEVARLYPQLRIVQAPAMADAFNKVRDGAADFALAPANMARYYLSYKYEDSLKIGGISSANALVVFAAPQGQKMLIGIIDKALADVDPQEYLEIIGRWRANSATDKRYWESLSSVFWASFGALCVLLLMAGYWIFTQRQRIIRKHRHLQQRQLILEQLGSAKDSAEKASRSKSVFLTTMSHEIRTPLNAIIGMLELVLARKGDDALNTRSVHIAYESANSLLALIGDILDISRIESGKLTLRPEPASLREPIESVANVFTGLARAKELSIRLELDELADQPVWIDALKFKQIISNLLSNSIKFTDYGGIVIQCQGRLMDDGSVAFNVAVRDTGAGIPATQIEQIFSPFFELDSAVNNPNAGAGLGLSISQSLTRLMEGNLSVESQLGVGTCMTFSARFQSISDVSDAPVQETETPGVDQPLTVLIVEDHLPSQYLLEQQIHYLGHRALIANNGVEGLALWQEHDVDIVLTDCNMPEMNGHDMTRAIRRLEARLGIRPATVVGLTAGALQEELERCLASGMNHALVKPINLAGLNQVLPRLNRDAPSMALNPLALPGEIQAAMSEKVINSNQLEIRALDQAVSKNDRDALGAIAHKLKGTAGLLNAPYLLHRCEALEQLIALDAEQPLVQKAVSQLQQALLELNERLRVD